MPRMRGQVTTSATTEVAVESTAYTEPTSGAQRSIKSSSANDTAAGTGARTVLITYYTLVAGVVAGPYTETVTLSGTVAAATTATNICLIDKLEVLTAGSGGKNAGTLSLYTDNAGVGSVIASIAVGINRTYHAHAYVPSGKRCLLTDIVLESGEMADILTLFVAKSLDYGTTGAVEKSLGQALAIQGSQGYRVVVPSPLLSSNQLPTVDGPARVKWYVTPGDTVSEVALVDCGFVNI